MIVGILHMLTRSEGEKHSLESRASEKPLMLDPVSKHHQMLCLKFSLLCILYGAQMHKSPKFDFTEFIRNCNII